MGLKNKKIIVINVLVGIAIIVVALFFLVPMWFGHVDSKMQQAAFDIKYLQDKLSLYYRDHGKYPSTEQGLKTLTETIGAKGQPYLIRIPNDPWGNSYHYRSPGNRNRGSYDLWTYCSDNKRGGDEDHSRDITNWD